ncbi:MAG: H-NS family nucleoid-associated regulatory protein [Hyphomicrobiaceae bacterium]
MKKARTTGINVEKMSLKEMQDLEAKLSKAKAAAHSKAKADMKQKIENMLNSAGMSIQDLYPSTRAGRGRIGAAGKAAKYVNPENRSETWTGRGRKPNWLVSKIAKGAKMQDFAV